MFRMTVQDVFAIKGRGTVATGRVEYGQLSVGDQVRINDGPPVQVDAIEAFRKKLDTAATGDNIGILFRKLTKGDVAAGDVLTRAASTSTSMNAQLVQQHCAQLGYRPLADLPGLDPIPANPPAAQGHCP